MLGKNPIFLKKDSDKLLIEHFTLACMNIKKTAALAALSTLPLLASSQSQAAQIHSYFDLNGGVTYERPLIKEVGDIPFSIRNVPAHHDDGGGYPGEIKKDSLEPSGRVTYLNTKFGAQTAFFNDHLAVRAGLGLDLIFNAQTIMGPNNRDDLAERGYLGPHAGTDHRGTGTALTYIFAGTSYFAEWNTFLRPSAFVETGFKLTDTVSLNFGARYHQQNLFLENGYDRYDHLSPRKKYEAATYQVVTPYVSLKVNDNQDLGKSNWYLGIDAGVLTPMGERTTTLGKKLDIQKNKFAPFVGIVGGIKF